MVQDFIPSMFNQSYLPLPELKFPVSTLLFKQNHLMTVDL